MGVRSKQTKSLGWYLALCLLAVIMLFGMMKKDSIWISKKSGYYSAEQIKVSLFVPLKKVRGYTIYYSTDCSEPSREQGILYEGPIEIHDTSDEKNLLLSRDDMSVWQRGIDTPVDKAEVIRAALYDKDGNLIDEISHTYWLGDNKNKSYIKKFPMLSIVCDPDDLINHETGILVRGQMFDYWLEKADDEDRELVESGQAGDRNVFANYRMRDDEWERKACINYLDRGRLENSRILGIKNRGRATSEGIQKGFNLYAREEYDGVGTIPDSMTGIGYGSESISLKRANGIYNADITISKQIDKLEAGGQRGKLVQVFINGEWWGVYTTMEKYNDDYFDHHYRVDTTFGNVIKVKSGKVDDENEQYLEEFKNLLEWTTYNDMEEDYSWISLNALVDVDSAIDYYAIQTYIGNVDTDDLWNNLIWRTRDTDPGNPYADGRWRYCLYDMDSSLIDSNQDTLRQPISQYHKALGENFMLKAILGNTEGRKKFFNRLSELSDNEFAYKIMHEYCVETDDTYELLEEQYNWRKMAGWEDKTVGEELSERDNFWKNRGETIQNIIRDYQ